MELEKLLAGFKESKKPTPLSQLVADIKKAGHKLTLPGLHRILDEHARHLGTVMEDDTKETAYMLQFDPNVNLDPEQTEETRLDAMEKNIQDLYNRLEAVEKIITPPQTH
jgi:hypothetical protein